MGHWAAINNDADNVWNWTLKEGVYRDFPGGPVVKTSPSNAGVWVQSLVGELRSHMTWSQNNKT